MIRNIFIRDGLRFECEGCSECCRTHGEYSFVYLATKNVDAISEFLGMKRIDFLNKHCQNDTYGQVHLNMMTGDCNFLDKDGRCEIYPVRPKQCDAWPFWTENLNPETWNGPVKDCCPGIGKGRLWSAEEIAKIAKDRDDWYEYDEITVFEE